MDSQLRCCQDTVPGFSSGREKCWLAERHSDTDSFPRWAKESNSAGPLFCLYPTCRWPGWAACARERRRPVRPRDKAEGLYLFSWAFFLERMEGWRGRVWPAARGYKAARGRRRSRAQAANGSIRFMGRAGGRECAMRHANERVLRVPEKSRPSGCATPFPGRRREPRCAG